MRSAILENEVKSDFHSHCNSDHHILFHVYRRLCPNFCANLKHLQDNEKSFCLTWRRLGNWSLIYMISSIINEIIIRLVPRAGKMNQIARCDWLPERARWSRLARSGLPAVSRKQNFTKSHIINPLLTKFVRSRWLDIGLVLFLRVYGPRLRLGP